MVGLRAVPQEAPRAIALVRVSKERDGMISPEVQRAAIADYARARGYVVTEWVEGLDEPGSRARSAWWPRLDAAVETVEAREAEVVLVWKFSRAARHRLRWAVAVDRIEAAGGRLESATEQVDTTTSTGRFTRGMLAELNAFEAERIGEVWKEVHGRRLADGYAPNGKPRFGYVWDAETKLHQIDPETGPVLAETYRRYVAGESVHSLVRWLNATGVRTTAGLPWSDRALRRVLDAGFAAGFITWRGERHEGRHDRLIDRDTWQAYLDARARRRRTPSRTQRSQYLLSGLVRCGRCQGSMVANNPGDGRRAPSFRCRTAKEFGPEHCAGGYVAMHVVEAEVLTWLGHLATQVDDERARGRAELTARVDARGEVARLTKRLGEIEAARARLTARLGEGLVSDGDYVSAVRAYDDEAREVAGRLDEHGRAARDVELQPAAVALDLVGGWRTTSVAARREVLRRLIDHVEVTAAGRTGGASKATVVVHRRGVD